MIGTNAAYSTRGQSPLRRLGVALAVLALAGTFRRATATGPWNITGALRGSFRLGLRLRRRRTTITALGLVVLILEEVLKLLFPLGIVSMIQRTAFSADLVEHNAAEIQLIRTSVLESHPPLFPRIHTVLLDAGENFGNNHM